MLFLGFFSMQSCGVPHERNDVVVSSFTVLPLAPQQPIQTSQEQHQTVQVGEASWYGPGFHRKLTASGKIYNQHELTAAHPTLPEGSLVKVTNLDNALLDHGTAVPLYFLDRYGWRGRVVALGYSFLSNEDHLQFGACIRKAADTVARSLAFVASGDLSHRLKPEAPAGYNPAAHRFDDEVVGALQDNAPNRIIEIDQKLRRTAGECGYRSMLIALGATRELPSACEVLNYEAPFGVGYLVAQITNAEGGTKQQAEPANAVASEDDHGSELPALARLAIETFVRTGKSITPSKSLSPLLSASAACFVSIKTHQGDLRGCIGTIEPIKQNLAEELIANAINAATRDPRFDPVSARELPNLRYSVDVLGVPEPADFEDLDPKVYGVIVEAESGGLRGLLLPDIAGVETARQQVDIAARKAGISLKTPLKLSRFRVDRYGEKK